MKSNFFNNIFKYKEKDNYEFILPNSSNNINKNEFESSSNPVSFNINENIEFLNSKYNILINSDIKIRKFELNINKKSIPAFLIYIDGMVSDSNINNYILKPFLLKNSISMTHTNQIISKIQVKDFDLKEFLYSSLIPQNNVILENNFNEIVSKINTGFCGLFVQNINTCFCIEVRGYKFRDDLSEPTSESVLRGSHEGFVENLRTNTSLLRRIINNEKLIIEQINVGKISKTPVAICYIKDITNDDLVSEIKYRISNLQIDYLISSGQLEQFISDNYSSSSPQIITTERPDKTANYILLGRIAILVNGSPFSLIVPSCLIDFLTSSEDFNLNYIYSNFLRILRLVALISALLVPGLYIAITTYHFELIPSELLFAIISARNAIPFPIFFEILIMEISFELIQEASLRSTSSFSTTVGIIGALILGDAAVSANIVSPILIIIVAYSGICAFAVPDNSLRFSIRMFRFIYIILGYIAGFLGIAFGLFIHLLFLTNQSSFGIPFFSPYIPFSDLSKNENIIINPVWKRETRNVSLNTKKPEAENHISMEWRQNGK